MKILVLDQFAELGGAQQCLLDLAPGILDQGWDLHLAAPADGPYLERAAELGATAHELRVGKYSSTHKGFGEQARFVGETIGLSRQIRSLAVEHDLLYVNGPRVLPAAALAASATPVLFHCQSRLFQTSAANAARLAIRSCAAKVVACCEYAAKPLALDRGRLRIIFNPGARKSEHPASAGCLAATHSSDAAETGRPPAHAGGSETARGPRIGVLGRIAPEKGQLEFVRAAKIISRSAPETTFIVCGDALFSDTASLAYRDQVHQEARDSSVELLGWRDDAAGILDSLDLVVIPSTREPGTTRVIFEAYAHKKPVVAFATGGIAEVAEHGRTAHLVSEPTPEALAAEILGVLRDPQGSRSMADAGHRLWQERFTVERYRAEMIDAIKWAAGRVP